MFDHMDGIMRAFDTKKTPLTQHLYFAVNLAQQMMSKWYAKITSTTVLNLIPAHISDRFRKLWSFKNWDTGMDINPEDQTSYTTQYQESFLKYVENEYCPKCRLVLVIKPESIASNHGFPSATASGSSQSSFDPYDLSSDDEEYWTPNNEAETTPERRDCTALLRPAAMLYWNSLPESPQDWGQVNPNVNDYHSDPMEISSTFWLPGITTWWQQQEDIHPKHADLSNVARGIFSIIPHSVGVEAIVPLGEVLLAGGNEKPHARPFAKMGLQGYVPQPVTGYCQAMTQRWLRRTQKITRKWRESGRAKHIAQNGQGPQRFGDVAGQPKPMCYTEGISCSNPDVDSRRVHFGYIRDLQSILITLLTWWCGCIQIVRKITFATSFVCKGPPWRMNSTIECPPNQTHRPSSCRKWGGHRIWKHFGHQPLATLHGVLDSPNDSEDDCQADVESNMDREYGIDDQEHPEQLDVSATQRSRIDSANTEVEELGWTGGGDGQYIGIKEE